VDRCPLGGKYGVGRFDVPADDGANFHLLKRNRFFESQANSYLAIFGEESENLMFSETQLGQLVGFSSLNKKKEKKGKNFSEISFTVY
jgi:hypothetical protein